MEMNVTKQKMNRAERIAMNKDYQPRTARMAYALGHPHMIEVVDPELRARLQSYQD